MAAKGGKKGGEKKNLETALSRLGLHGDFHILIDRAIREDWGTDQFIIALTKTAQFQHSFPGLLENGQLATFLTGGADGVTATNLGRAIGAWKSLRNSYRQAARGYGYSGFTGTPQQMKKLIEGQVSPTEFASKINALSIVRQNPDLLDAYNAELKVAGEKPLNKQGWLNVLAGTADKKYYDIYEAAQLRSNFGLNAASAYQTAQGIGAPGQPTDLSGTISQTKQLLGSVSPELAKAGITTEELIASMAQQGHDAAGIGNVVQGILNQRQAAGGAVRGSQAQQGAGGGLQLFNTEGAASGV